MASSTRWDLWTPQATDGAALADLVSVGRKVAVDPAEDNCYRIFLNKACLQNVLTDEQVDRIGKCWRVENMVFRTPQQAKYVADREAEHARYMAYHADDTKKLAALLENEECVFGPIYKPPPRGTATDSPQVSNGGAPKQVHTDAAPRNADKRGNDSQRPLH